MRFIYHSISLLGIIFFIYYGWTDSIPWWFKDGFLKLFNRGSEVVKTLPKEDWSKPLEVETKKEGEDDKKEDEKKPRDQKAEAEKKEGDKEKSLFSGEIKLGNLRSRYNLGIKQSEESEAVGKKDMGAEEAK